MAITVGDPAPDFRLKNTAGDEVSLGDFTGESNVILVFFPAAFSGVCTGQLSGLEERAGVYAQRDAQVIGISVDQRASLAAFGESLGLSDVMLLSDAHPKGEVARAYDTYLEDFGFAARTVFAIDREGTIRAIERTENPGQDVDAERYLAALSACEVSPAS